MLVRFQGLANRRFGRMAPGGAPTEFGLMRVNGPRSATFRCAATFVPLLLAGLGACTTQVKVQPSAAVLEVRRATADRVRPGGGCADPRDLGTDATVIPFGFLQADLDDSAMRRIRMVSAWGRCAPANRIVLTGEADNHGTATEQADLVARRLATVRRALTDAGVADERISIAASAKDVPGDARDTLVLLGRGRGW